MGEVKRVRPPIYRITRTGLTICLPGFLFFMGFPAYFFIIPELHEILLSNPLHVQIILIVLIGLFWFVSVYYLMVWIRTFSRTRVEGVLEDIRLYTRRSLFVLYGLALKVDGSTYTMVEQSGLKDRLQVGMEVALEVDGNGQIAQIEWNEPL